MAKPVSGSQDEYATASHRRMRIVAIHEMTRVLLEWADELELHQAGSHLSMAMHVLRTDHPELGLPEESPPRDLRLE